MALREGRLCCVYLDSEMREYSTMPCAPKLTCMELPNICVQVDAGTKVGSNSRFSYHREARWIDASYP